VLAMDKNEKIIIYSCEKKLKERVQENNLVVLYSLTIL